MDGEDEHDGGKGWEVVAPASAARPSSTSATSYGDDFCVFPPSLHEGLPPNLTLDSPSSSPKGLAENYKGEEEEAAEPECRHVSPMRIAESARRLVESGIELIRSKIGGLSGGGGGCGNGGAVWSFAAVAGFAGVLMYMRRRHRRERDLLLFMILEKDEVTVLFLLGI